MGLSLDWHTAFIATAQTLTRDINRVEHQRYSLYAIGHGGLVVNLISIANDYEPDQLVLLQEDFQEKDIQLVHLWEDVWLTRKEQVIGRLKSILGLNIRVHGRKTKVLAITQPQAAEFLNKNHLQSSVNSRYKYALVAGDQMIAVACFSGLRKMKNRTIPCRSAELVRFANLNGYTVIGGFTKLLQHFIKLHSPDDIMSYADRDWSLGAAYQRSGFKLVDTTPPAVILLNESTLKRLFPHRLDTSINEKVSGIFNTGNLKYILEL